jgi:hypothetical protein
VLIFYSFHFLEIVLVPDGEMAAQPVGEMVAIRKSAYPMPCFTRHNTTAGLFYYALHCSCFLFELEFVLIRARALSPLCLADFVFDLNHRLMYQRQIRGAPESAKRTLVPQFGKDL